MATNTLKKKKKKKKKPVDKAQQTKTSLPTARNNKKNRCKSEPREEELQEDTGIKLAA